MIEVYEVVGQEALDAAAKFKAQASPLDRVFIMEDDGLIGVAVIGLDKGVVTIKDILTDKPFEYFDLLARSVLSVIKDFNPIRVRVLTPDPYFFRFGFSQNMEILSEDINLAGWCRSGCDNCEKDCKNK